MGGLVAELMEKGIWGLIRNLELVAELRVRASEWKRIKKGEFDPKRTKLVQ
jgi:hypothetical protein